jgi:DNA-directed RNA polymerase II subunit RPB9
MLYPKEDRAAKKLMFVCKRCNYEEVATAHVVYRHELVKSAG